MAAAALLFMALLGAVTSLSPVQGVQADPQWEAYKQRFRKQYATVAEEEERHRIFRETLDRIDALNRRNGEAVFGLTAMSDRRPNEKYARGARPPPVQHKAPLLGAARLADAAKPAAIDWRRTKAVTPVKNQGQCGSCWAFSTAETVESQFILKLGGDIPLTLSPQQVTSCTATCDGCGGGWPADGYRYLETVPGLASSFFWPYAQGLTPNQQCLAKSCTQSCSAKNVSALTADEFYVGRHATISGFAYATPPCTDACAHQDLAKLATSLQEGPVAVCVNAGAWDDYTGGVLTAEGCGGSAYYDLDHCVQLVGYNTTAEKPYWIVRNSWDTVWGMDGYIHLEFNTNACGIADEATIPMVSGGLVGAELEAKHAQALREAISDRLDGKAASHLVV